MDDDPNLESARPPSAPSLTRPRVATATEAISDIPKSGRQKRAYGEQSGGSAPHSADSSFKYQSRNTPSAGLSVCA